MADATPPPATQAFSDVHLAAPTRKCSHCGERFTLIARRGRNSDKRHANATRSYHLGTRYCSYACRYAAHEARRNRLRRNASSVGQNAKKERGCAQLPSSVGHAEISLDKTIASKPEKTGRGSPKNAVLDPRIVPDPKSPGMYWVRRPDGSLSDMANLTRAKDALAELWRGRS
jgi:hypothetical protein